MKIEDQLNKVQSELNKLLEMFEEKSNLMNKQEVNRPDCRRVANQCFVVKTIIQNNFTGHLSEIGTGDEYQLMYAGKVADKHIK